MAVVTIRDNRASRFTSPVYNRSLVENIGVNELVTTANDPDGDDITYSIMICFLLYLLLRLNTGLFRKLNYNQNRHT